jgi:hypothetical protein
VRPPRRTLAGVRRRIAGKARVHPAAGQKSTSEQAAPTGTLDMPVSLGSGRVLPLKPPTDTPHIHSRSAAMREEEQSNEVRRRRVCLNSGSRAAAPLRAASLSPPRRPTARRCPPVRKLRSPGSRPCDSALRGRCYDSSEQRRADGNTTTRFSLHRSLALRPPSNRSSRLRKRSGHSYAPHDSTDVSRDSPAG